MQNLVTVSKICRIIGFMTGMSTGTGTGSVEKVMWTSVGRKTSIAQYLSSSSASLIEMSQSFCSYRHRTCMRNKLEGFDYCIRHILEDRNAPYKQCSYVSSRTGHKCSEAALRTEKRERFVSLFGRCLDGFGL